MHLLYHAHRNFVKKFFIWVRKKPNLMSLFFIWWPQQDSNLRPTDYESAALTTEL